MRLTNEMKTGLVVVMGILIAVLFFLKTTNLQTKTYEFKTYFTYAGDLKPDAVVKLSGIEAGRVTAVKFIYDPQTRVECTIQVDAKAKVRVDSIAYIGTAGFVGDAFIGLTPGTSEEFVKNGGTIASEDPIQMRLLFKKADSIAKNLDSILAEVKSVVKDNRQNFDDIILNLEVTSENFQEFSEDVKKHPWKLLFKGE
ncbi:MAG: MlaD family protein [Candidatus Tantalella remota]|nr:MlaD family protein [Candidatus Tantalella remota]